MPTESGTLRQPWRSARTLRRCAGLGALALTVALAGCEDASDQAREGGTRLASAASSAATPGNADGKPEQNAARGERGGGGGAPGGRGPRQSLVSSVDVQLETVNDRMSAVGSARARQRATLLTQAAGVVEEVLFKPGDKVEKGAPLMRLDRRAEEIAVLRAQSALKFAKATADRLERLGANATEVSRQDASNALATAEADLAAAQYEFDRREVRAPFSGVLGITDVYPGQYLTAGAQVATLDDRSTLILAFTLPERAMSLDLMGKTARANARTELGRFYEGEIVAVDSRVDASTRTLRVEAALPNPEGRLLPGATYSVTVLLEGERAPTLPALAVQWDRRGAHVWRVKNDDTVERVDVVILRRDGDQVALRGPLQEGDRVVHEGGDNLIEGAKIRDASAPRAGGKRGAAPSTDGERRNVPGDSLAPQQDSREAARRADQ